MKAVYDALLFFNIFLHFSAFLVYFCAFFGIGIYQFFQCFQIVMPEKIENSAIFSLDMAFVLLLFG